MPLEIERRFLVRGGQGVWSTDSVRIVQGYIPLPEGWNQRVRIIEKINKAKRASDAPH